MSRRRNAPYADRIEDEGRTLIYEGHDARKNDVRDPRPLTNHGVRPSGSLTQNGRFEQAALAVTHGAPEYVRVYEKLHDGVWAYNGPFALTGVTTDFDSVATSSSSDSN